MKELSFSSFYTELDAILDTRFAVISTFGEEALTKAIIPTYFVRSVDKFDGVDMEEFNKRYSNRDRTVLRNSIMTEIPGLIRDFCLKTAKQSLNTPFKYRPRLIVNQYPYELNEDEANIIVQRLVELTAGLADVSLINKRREEITIEYLNKMNVTVMALYHYKEWLDSQASFFFNSAVPGLTLFAPSIFDKEMRIEESEKLLEQITTHLNTSIGIQFLPADDFSLIFKVLPKKD